MAAFVTSRAAATYTTDDADDVPCRVANGYFGQASLGWVANTNGHLPKPGRGLRKRAVFCVTAGGARRRVIVATPAAFDAIVTGTSTLQVDVASVETAALVYLKEGERKRGDDVPTYAG